MSLAQHFSLEQKSLHALEDDLGRLRQACEGLRLDSRKSSSTYCYFYSTSHVQSVKDLDIEDAVLEQFHKAAQKSSFMAALSQDQLVSLLHKAEEEFTFESSNSMAEIDAELQVRL